MVDTTQMALRSRSVLVHSSICFLTTSIKPAPFEHPCTTSFGSKALLIRIWVESRHSVSSSCLQRVPESIVAELHCRGAIIGVDHLRPQIIRGPAIPSNKRTAKPNSERILNVELVISIRVSETMRAPTILMVDEQRMITLDRERILGVLIVAMTRRRHAHHGVAFDKDDDVLPIVAMTSEEAASDRLVFLEVVLVPGNVSSVYEICDSLTYIIAQ